MTETAPDLAPLPCAVCGKRPGEQGRGWRLARPDESGTGNGIRRCEGCNPPPRVVSVTAPPGAALPKEETSG